MSDEIVTQKIVSGSDCYGFTEEDWFISFANGCKCPVKAGLTIVFRAKDVFTTRMKNGKMGKSVSKWMCSDCVETKRAANKARILRGLNPLHSDIP